MKTILSSLILGFALSALAVDKAELDNRVRELTAELDAMQRSAKAVPADALRKAQGIVLLSRTKAGFIFAYQGGGGVAVVKDAKTGEWSPTAFLSANEASLGFQIGGEQNFYVILLMNTNATRLLTEPKFEFGGEARGTAGDATSGVEGKVTSVEQPVLVYDSRQGLFGGVAIKGGGIVPDDGANRAYYGEFPSMRDILFDKKVKHSEATTALIARIIELSKPPEK